MLGLLAIWFTVSFLAGIIFVSLKLILTMTNEKFNDLVKDIDINNAGLGTTWIQLSGWLSFFSYVIAECISYYNVATTNEWWAATEVIVDGLAFLIMFPAALYLFIQQWH